MRFLFDRIKHFDIPLILASGILVIIGLSLIYASSLANPTLSLFYRQLVFVGIGIVLYAVCSLYNYHRLAKMNRWVYIVLIAVLLFVLFFGTAVRGSARWIDLGFFRFQPAEFAKIIVAIGLARWLYLRRGEINSWKNIALTLLYAAIPAALIMLEPDLGSSIVVLGVWAGVLTISWVNKKFILGIALAFILIAGIGWKFFLQDFQKTRIEVFLNPELDPKGRGYNVRQATIAVGSGQLLGRGLGKGLQSQLKFLPERQTDFIFATSAEEVGFVGCTVILLLYGIIISRIWLIMTRSRDELGKYIAGGVLCMLFVQIVVNIGMNIGLLPVTGIPLPLLSYGGSSLIVVFISLGIVQNIARQTHALRF